MMPHLSGEVLEVVLAVDVALPPGGPRRVCTPHHLAQLLGRLAGRLGRVLHGEVARGRALSARRLKHGRSPSAHGRRRARNANGRIKKKMQSGP